MSEILHLRTCDAKRLPWKNGRGFTDELALWPHGASLERADFDWRISKAAVEEDGPFSSFPGIERVLVVTRGAGILLDHGSAAPCKQLAALVPYRFSGDWPTTAQLVSGRITDFNVLCRRALVRADVEVWTGRVARELRLEPGAHGFVHLLEGALEARASEGDGAWKLVAGESLRIDGAARVRLRSRGTAILVRIEIPCVAGER